MFRALKLAIVPAVLVLGLGLFSANTAKAHEPGCPGYGYGGHYGYDDFPSHRVYDLGGSHDGSGRGGSGSYGRSRVHVHPLFDVHHGHLHGGIVIHGRFGAFNIHW